MRILQLCLRVPFPPQDGATIAMYNMAHSLANAGAEIKMLAFNTKKHFVNTDSIAKEIKSKFRLETVYLDASVKIIPALLNIFKKSESYNIIRFDSEEFHDKLKEILSKETFDIVQCEGLFLSPYIETIRTLSKAKVILRAHNVEWLIWQRLADACSNPVKKWYLQFLASRLKKYENNIINKFDAIVALTNEDKKLFEDASCKVPVVIAPIGVNTNEYDLPEKNSDTNKLSLFHLGSMDWMPNLEAVEWLLANIWQKVLEENKDVTLYIAGKNMPQKFFSINSTNLIVDGEIKDAKKYMSTKTIMIVPLLSGGGMRVKIIEGLALGKIIISTTIGAEGIEYTNGKNILIANTPEEFCNAIASCANKNLLQSVSHEAKLLAKEKYDNIEIGKKLFGYYKSILE